MNKSDFFCRLPKHWISDPSLCWFEWQAFAAGLLAVLAATLGAYFLNRQTKANTAIYEDDITRRHNSAKILALPLLLKLSNNIHKSLILVSNISGLVENKKYKIAELVGKELEKYDPNPSNDDLITLRELIQTFKGKSESICVELLFTYIKFANSKLEHALHKLEYRNIDEVDTLLVSAFLGYLQAHAMMGAIITYCSSLNLNSNNNISHLKHETFIRLVYDLCYGIFEISNPSTTARGKTLVMLKKTKISGKFPWENKQQ